MPRTILILLLSLSLPMPMLSRAAVLGQWRCHQAYSEPAEVRAAGGDVFVLASGGLYCYSKAGLDIRAFDRTTGLSSTGITHIAWSRAAGRLIATYADSYIDLVEPGGRVTAIPDLHDKSMVEDKTINTIRINGSDAYLGTMFGIVRVDMRRGEISETYKLGLRVWHVAIVGTTIYAHTNKGVYGAPMEANLIDKAQWTWRADVDQHIFDDDTADWDANIETVRTLAPGGPEANDFGFLRFAGGKLYAASSSANDDTPARVQVWDGSRWERYDNDLEQTLGHKFVGLTCVDVDPKDPAHVFAGGQTGLYEYHGGKFVREYNYTNSPLKPACVVPQDAWPLYSMVTGLKFDAAGTLWLANSLAEGQSLLSLDASGKWERHHSDKLCANWTSGTTGQTVRGSYQNLGSLAFDRLGTLWTSNDNWSIPVIAAYRDGGHAVYSQFANQDGNPLALTYIRRQAFDRDGNLWAATSAGPMMVPAEEMDYHDGPALTFTQVKIPRNDGSGLADYLLADIPTSAIAIDGSNRKWIGTYGAGVYLVGPDGTEQLRHFTAANSLLLSDEVNDIAVDDATGEVYIATDKGLCSYVSDATAPAEAMTKETVFAYPNPVPPGFTGLITVTGLTFDADVKILTASGALVRQGRSNGGTFTWDGRDMDGREVASGVYSIATATQDGKKGAVCKLAVVR